MTALHIAAERGNIKMVEYLADKEANIDIKDKKYGVIYVCLFQWQCDIAVSLS